MKYKVELTKSEFTYRTVYVEAENRTEAGLAAAQKDVDWEITSIKEIEPLTILILVAATSRGMYTDSAVTFLEKEGYEVEEGVIDKPLPEQAVKSIEGMDVVLIIQRPVPMLTLTAAMAAKIPIIVIDAQNQQYVPDCAETFESIRDVLPRLKELEDKKAVNVYKPTPISGTWGGSVLGNIPGSLLC